MKSLIATIALILMAFGCSSPAEPIDGTNGANGNSGGKADTVGMNDGGVAVAEDTPDTDGGLEELELEGDGGEPQEVEDVDGGIAEPAVDPFAEAWDVTIHHVHFPEDTEAPIYQRPSGTRPFNLGGTEFWQKWTGGHNPTYSYSDGTEYGKRCMFASARRFEAIMTDPPEALVQLREDSNWSGSFFNWNDDFSQSDWSDGRSARLWAWRTSLVKWISQTNRDGTCFLPTYEMVEAAAANCQGRSDSSDGEIQGCRAP
jgi:hypothetical protein